VPPVAWITTVSIPHGRKPCRDAMQVFGETAELLNRLLAAPSGHRHAVFGRAFGRNQRIRRSRVAMMPKPPQAVPLCPAPQQTTAEAVALLDTQFPSPKVHVPWFL